MIVVWPSRGTALSYIYVESVEVMRRWKNRLEVRSSGVQNFTTAGVGASNSRAQAGPQCTITVVACPCPRSLDFVKVASTVLASGGALQVPQRLQILAGATSGAWAKMEQGSAGKHQMRMAWLMFVGDGRQVAWPARNGWERQGYTSVSGQRQGRLGWEEAKQGRRERKGHTGKEKQ